MSPFSCGFFFEFFFSHFLCSHVSFFPLFLPFPSFFLFLFLLFSLSLFLLSLFFFFSCLLLPSFFEKICVFIFCPCRDAEAFSHHSKEKKTHPESFVKNQIARVVKIVLCELRSGRKPRSLSSLLRYLLSSLNFCVSYILRFSCLKYLFLSIVYFSTQRITLFSLTRMGTIISFSCSKSLFVLSVVQISSFGISCSLISKN